MEEQETIHVPGEVIPPGTESEVPQENAQSGERADARAMRMALVIAVVADLLQLLLFPLFAEGALSPLNDALDIAVGLAMVKLVGWHWAFLPSLVAELVPGLDELPCWTLAVLFVRSQKRQIE